jgi:hypothetical protein
MIGTDDALERTRPGDQARWYGPETPVVEWRKRLACSMRGRRNVDMVVTGNERR